MCTIKIINKKKRSKTKKTIFIFLYTHRKPLMNIDTALIAFGIASLTIGVTLLTIYSSFGPGAENLIDPFEEDDD